MSELYLVRHAKAGKREASTDDDRLRPLSKSGRRQAEGLVRLFRGREVERILSSPFVRCVQTVRPLAIERGSPIEETSALSEGASVTEALDLIAELGDVPAVLCSHGDVIPALVEHLAENGMTIDGERDWRKGSTWVLERNGGRFRRAHSMDAPA
ncbi:MAG TPA: phosphoglycerate mutase family protein [Actinomycetota bacterium]|nr:phosphoglycerate mutase family protein [Actinomycetota bacterium]